MPRDTTRRSVLKAAAWSTPVVAAAVAVPLAAASTPATFILATSDTQIASGRANVVTVTVPASAVPVTPGTVTLDYTRVAGGGTISAASFVGTWAYSWPAASNLIFTANASATPGNNLFTVTFSGEATWSVTLRTPQGDFNTQIQVLAPA